MYSIFDHGGSDGVRRNGSDIFSYWFGFWFVALTGIAVAGGIFGFCVAFVAGMIAGPFVAGFFALPAVIIAAVITWAFWLSRYAPVMAAVAGAATGILATATAWATVFFWDYPTSLLLAAVIGGVVPGWLTYAYSQKRREFLRAAGGIPDRAWQFSLRDLFVRCTVVTILIGLISCIAITMR